jgi:DNA polymerase III epsilon subunit-like protein
MKIIIINDYLLIIIMSKTKKFCTIYSETNGLHTTSDNVSKKNLYSFARLVALNYEIGYNEHNKFVSTKKVRVIVKPRCMNISDDSIKIHGITMEQAFNEGVEIETILDNFIKDLSDVSILISHNVEFHFKTIIAEFVRYNKPFSFTNFIIIDTISFYHKISYPKLEYLYNTLYPKKTKKSITNLEMIRQCFIKLYSDYENSIH